MAQLMKTFDPSQVAPASAFEPLPAGWYPAMIVASESKETSKADGWYLKLKVQIIEGDFKGRNIWTMLHLGNANPKAVEIAEGQFSALCRALGSGPIDNSDVLHDKPLSVKLTVKPESNGYAASNDIQGWKALETAPVTPVTFALPKAPPAANAWKAAPAAKSVDEAFTDDIPF